jgi:hypothetical protein
MAYLSSDRDRIWFLPDQVAEYDKKRLSVQDVLQLEIAVSDEQSAVGRLRQQLTMKTQIFQDLQPQFMEQTRAGWQKHEEPLELPGLLEQHFLHYDGAGEVPSQVHSYLSTNYKALRGLPKDASALRTKAGNRWCLPDRKKAGDVEERHEQALLREFEEYRESKQKRLKVLRIEAVSAGFKKAWQARDYARIIAAARKIRETVLQEDPKPLM